MKKYNPQLIEKKWQKVWERSGIYNTPDKAGNPPSHKASEGRGKNFYKLFEWPYPSGNLHIGHWYAFGVPDIFARYKRMQGYNIIYPFGVDAFGLPAENAAIKRNINPAVWTKQNIKDMTKQLRTMGAMLDWSRFIDSSNPQYYKWTQWIFLQFYKNNLAYRAKTLVNWCPKDKTVLANEQVKDGLCDRCDSEVEQREREQWMYRITKYADALVDDLDTVDWPESTKLAQRNWIGRSEGAEINFKLNGIADQDDEKHSVTVFTTRPDTLFGATFLVISPELGKKWLDLGWKASNDVRKYIDKSLNKSELDRISEQRNKTGVDTEIKAINPATKKTIPVWIADYVVGSYGTGAIMAVPAHDERDKEFAKKFDLPILIVVENDKLINSVDFNGMDFEKAKWAITKAVEGKRTKTYRLRDWGLSRQRYWGTPIPLVFCENCESKIKNQKSKIKKEEYTESELKNPGWIPVPEEQLPVKLPKLDNFLPADDGLSPLARAEKWVNTKCPKCGGKARRETDTMDTFVDSSWYFMRYTDPNNDKKFASKEKMAKWLPVDLYTGGAEHNTMHLLYSRFFTKAMHELGLIDFSVKGGSASGGDEPFKMRRNHGMILGPDGNKMSKSKDNVIDPDKEVAQYGADTVRMYLAFLGPYDNFIGPWNPKGIIGIQRFLHRVWKMIQGHRSQNTDHRPENTNSKLNTLIHSTIKKVGEDIEVLHFNTAISALMSCLNEIEQNRLQLTTYNLELFLQILAPFAPHITEELWYEIFGNKKSIHLQSWPKYDPKLLVQDITKFAIQINGKTRAVIELPIDSNETEVIEKAKADPKVSKHLTSEIKKTIFIPNKLINFVV